VPVSLLTLAHKIRHDQSGSVLVIAAASMGALLLLGAMAIDAGNWFTHKRQIQNRADAAAFAAGVQYEKDWRACLGGDATVAQTIANAARQYAADPTYTGAPLQNNQVADQSKLLVNINKTGYDPTSSSDGGGPCFNHPAGTDPISPNGGTWTDVKVNESSVPLFFGGFGISPPRINAEARIGLNPVGSENGFSPLALQVSSVEAAQIRLYSICSNTTSLLGTYTLQKLGAANQTLSGMTLWGNPDASGNNQFVSVPIPSAAGCGADYVKIGTEIRIVGKLPPNGPDINGTCSGLSGAQFGGCWTDIGGRWGPEVRDWKNSGTPLFGDAHLTGTGCGPDPYFSTTTSCQTGIALAANWGAACADTNVAHFQISVNGVALLPPSGTPNGTWTSANNAAFTLSATGGGTAFVAGYHYTGSDTNCPGRTGNPTVNIHSGFVATDSNSGVVQLVKLTNTATVDPAQGPVSEFDTVQGAGSNVNVYLTVGFQAGFSVGPLLKLRSSSPQESGSINCNNVNQGGTQSFTQFVNGCTPYYGPNSFAAGTWWSGSPPACPAPNNFPANSKTAPWRCAPGAPGLSATQIADGIAAHTGNCTINNNNNGCTGTPTCVNANHFVAGQTPSNSDPRLVAIFLVPYGAFNGNNGGSFAVPVTDVGRFYVTSWGGSGANADPCAGDAALPPGEIDGHFVDVLPIDSTPDPTQNCDINQLRACLATLVR
jgi:hypothetical protein